MSATLVLLYILLSRIINHNLNYILNLVLVLISATEAYAIRGIVTDVGEYKVINQPCTGQFPRYE